MSIVFGALVAVAGCQQGMACGTSAMAVGQATTRAVVMGIVLIVVSASVMTIIFINLGSDDDAARQRAAHIEIRDLTMAYGDFVIQKNLNFTVRRGDIFIIMGGSGCGKSTLLKVHDRAEVAGRRATSVTQANRSGAAADARQEEMKRRFGVLFQGGALWSSHDAGGERRTAADAVHAPADGGDPRPVRVQAGAGRPRGLRRLLSERDLRRHEKARRACARDGDGPGHPLLRRTFRGARSRSARSCSTI